MITTKGLMKLNYLVGIESVNDGQSIACRHGNIENNLPDFALYLRAHLPLLEPIGARAFIRYGGADPSLYIIYLKFHIGLSEISHFV